MRKRRGNRDVWTENTLRAWALLMLAFSLCLCGAAP
jgi:hypothetical protein